ncbi:ABC-type nitrate/sulfonate/bicarbonate transport system substrate-binding protein [Ruminiclostridium sufflavum DSM 19573]|uniref:ABC-type nitrate/sulfonate/bicarbonate transport system substrate-binding protein n=1 Tax=Ruminiclostridium sufflavum DSM 19573 TaxID=1121337 RepID=A0A318XS85_9FIRM|nr:ABC transporter substrate-binding protein [Ruminiclostridium sufflavum]PYG89434.1 ABC-type nitrate/sulfonate/bicarbonate transport system substrate-binding protein [Ruminiclostridium sufflavum DSM 19573]
MKKILTFVLLASVVMSLTGCGGTDTATDTTTPQSGSGSNALTKVLTSGQNVVQTSVPLVAGDAMGTWKELGLEVEKTSYVSGPPQLEANPSGDWNIGWIGATAAITGILKYDMNVIGLSGYDYSNVAFAREDSDIVKAGDKGVAGTLGTAEEWRGKKIIVGVGTVNYADLMLTLKELGLSANDVTIINMDISTGMQAFLSGSGDIWFGSSTYAIQVAAKPGYKTIHTMQGMDAGMAGNIIANRDYLSKNEDAVVKYLEGSIEVLLWLNDENNANQAADWFVQGMKQDFGVEMTKIDALDNIKQTGFKDLKFYESLCEEGSDGLTGLQREFKKFYEYHVIIGSQKEENMQKVLDAVDCTYLKKAIELYKKDHNIS